MSFTSNVYPTGTNLLSVKITQSKIKRHVKHSLISILDFLFYYFLNFGKSLFPLISLKILKKGYHMSLVSNTMHKYFFFLLIFIFFKDISILISCEIILWYIYIYMEKLFSKNYQHSYKLWWILYKFKLQHSLKKWMRYAIKVINPFLKNKK